MIILIGKSGYVSLAYQDFFKKRQISHRCLSRHEINPEDPKAVKEVLKALRPSFLINAAGYTGKPNVDACEIHQDECIRGNLLLVQTLKSACGDLGLPWGHVSSGCIYQGNSLSGKGFTEEEAPNFSFKQQNCSFYSGVKAMAEDLLRNHPHCYVWRPRMPFNEVPGPRNLLSKLLAYPLLLDAENSLSQTDEFIRASWECWEQRIPFGTYNLTNPGSITTRQITEIMAAMNLGPRNFSFFPSHEAFLKTVKAPRSSCVLNTDKLQKAGITMRPVVEAITESLRSFPKN